MWPTRATENVYAELKWCGEPILTAFFFFVRIHVFKVR